MNLNLDSNILANNFSYYGNPFNFSALVHGCLCFDGVCMMFFRRRYRQSKNVFIVVLLLLLLVLLSFKLECFMAASDVVVGVIYTGIHIRTWRQLFQAK